MKSSPSFSLFIQYPDTRLKDAIPRWQIRNWVRSAVKQPLILTIRFVDSKEGRVLNQEFRNKDYATNVLTFTYDSPPDIDSAQPIAADIILCTDVILAEAKEQNKTVKSHLAHLIIHGVLHAQGYDHETEDEATEMEAMETMILARFGIANPYE